VFSAFEKGGILMFPLVLCSVLAVAIIVERYFFFKKIARGAGEDLIERVKKSLSSSQLEEAVQLCKAHGRPLGAILAAGLERIMEGETAMSRTMKEITRKEIPLLERHIAALGTIASVSPLLGLLGTVAGMIKVFEVIGVKGVGVAQSQALAVGISEALITTATGLSVAIPALVAYHYFSHRIDVLVDDIEIRMTELLNYVRSGGRNVETPDTEAAKRRS